MEFPVLFIINCCGTLEEKQGEEKKKKKTIPLRGGESGVDAEAKYYFTKYT